jgi:hypothetical protein
VFNFTLIGHIIPLAIGHTFGEENKESWSWFLSKVRETNEDYFKGCVLFMDREKGGVKAAE